MTRPRILVTNDDGIYSQGLAALAEELSEIAHVIVVAPDREQSATSHSLTLHRPLRISKTREHWYRVDGTPTDCVNLAVQGLLKEERPDLVVSGINFGPNLGDDVTYSGTVSATFEANLQGLPAIAFSQEISEGFSFEAAARFARRLVGDLLHETNQHLGNILLNVNFPAETPYRGVRFCRLGKRRYEQTVVEKLDPRGRKYYWIAGTAEWDPGEGTDFAAVSAGYVAVTPLHLDLTDYPGLEEDAPVRAAIRHLSTEGV